MADLDKLLRIFAAAGDRWVSGEELAGQLGVSRAAVWKQMEALRAAGYTLEAQPRLGYRLTGRPDAVTPQELLPGLYTRSFGRQVEYRESVGSTNELAKQLARGGAPEGLLVIADEQTAGKGRLGRAWSTPKGSAIAMSLILRPSLPPHLVSRVTLVAAVAVAEAIREAAGVPVGIKWPNDLQLHGKKICGILTEMEAEVERVAFLVCGMGINVNIPAAAFPPEVQPIATSLMAERGEPLLRAPLVRAILTRFESAYDDLLAGRFDLVLERWRRHSSTLGQQVRVLTPAGDVTLEGTAEDVDGDGALLIRTDGGALHRVVAGELSIRPR